ncbi:MAG: homoserine kinase [Armatimonadetes bacterium]|nr:homoserine kinase [Armatimonadota bacterium]
MRKRRAAAPDLPPSAPRRITVLAPATTANLGPGFDSLGLALQLYNRLTLEVIPAGLEVSATGEGAAELPRDDTNLTLRAMRRLFEAIDRPLPPLRVRQENAIPLARGLGSSSAAIVAGLVGANALAGDPLSTADLVNLGTSLEGHPDNVTACLTGGLAVTAVEVDRVHFARVPVPDGLQVVLYIPAFEMSTSAARHQLPDSYRRADAVFALSRAALTTAAFATGRWELLRVSMQDSMHQPYRAKRYPQMPHLIAAAIGAGARGAALSGSGPTIAAFADHDADAVAHALEAEGTACGLQGRAVCVAVDSEGARVVTAD